MILNAIKPLNIMKKEVLVSPNLYAVILYRDIVCGYKSLESVSIPVDIFQLSNQY